MLYFVEQSRQKTGGISLVEQQQQLDKRSEYDCRAFF